MNGAVHTFEFDASQGTWRLEQTLFPSDLDEYYTFGRSLCLSEERLLVGCPVSDLAAPDAGAGYVFDFVGGCWIETGTIAPVEPSPHGFGRSVAVLGGAAVIGQPQLDLAWFYAETPGGWVFRQKLTPPDDPPVNSEFGNAVAISDDWVFVAAHFDKSLGQHSGGVYAYRRDGEQLIFTQKLLAPDPGGVPEFGADISVSGDWLAVGAPRSTRRTTGQGVVHLFERSGEDWVWRQEVTHAEPFLDDYLGARLQLFEGTLVAGAPRQRTAHGLGSAYIFKQAPDGNWREATQLEPDRGTSPFGDAVATDGRWAVVGSPDETIGPALYTGAAYIFDLDCLLACPADLDGDGELTFFDFLAFGNLFAAGDLRADFDGSGALDLFDFLAFQTAFAAGC
ncbi:MAG: GC-type dockerin domain-anchored protein [Phycisphaerales bacterium JB039]